ncbi:MAG: hypothetical protein PVG53_14055 [Holophagae bacterium]|jgi:hypothetical protein
MASDNRVLWVVFAVLIALIAVWYALWRAKESRRPVLDGVRIVTATADDPVFRTGSRRVPPDTEVRIAAALRLRRGSGDPTWLAPVDELVVDGTPVEHDNRSDWPDADRQLRVFWFTVENAFLGGDLTADKVPKLLEQRTFLAPEMGRELLASRVPEQHNDDQISLGDELVPVAGGTVRLYVRVEITNTGAPVALQSVASRGPDGVNDPDFPTLRLAATFPDPVDATVGELFRLPGFEPTPTDGGSADAVTEAARGVPFSQLVEDRFVVSSRTFASVALTGRVGLDLDALDDLGAIDLAAAVPTRSRRPLRWGDDVRSGDLIDDRGQLIVLLADDDGDGELGRADRVATCWRRPAAVTTLDQSIREDAATARLLRHGG